MEAENDNDRRQFIRSAYYGFGLAWYGFDKFGHIAVFSSGDLPMPKMIFTDESAYRELNNFFENLPSNTQAILSDRCEKIKQATKGRADFFGSLRDAKRKIFAIGEINTNDGGEYLEGNYLTAIPNEKLNVFDLPNKIRELIKPYYLPVDFSKIDKIDLTEFFECE